MALTQTEFSKTIESFNAIESMRGKIYPMVLALIDANFVIEAHILFLSTWNFAGFRYVVPSFDLSAYEVLVQDLTRRLKPVSRANFASVDFVRHRKIVIECFDDVAAIKGVGITGASKILHLLNPRVFVMWDTAIRGDHIPKKDYDKLDIVRRGFWKPPKLRFAGSGDGYCDFLVYCQHKFNGLISPSPDKTLAKCIDEFNYCCITQRLPKPRKKTHLTKHGR